MIYDYKTQRQHYILSELQKNGRVSVSLLAKYFRVADRTIRRDIRDLEKTGRIKSCYGGATLVKNHERDLFNNNHHHLYYNIKINFSERKLNPRKLTNTTQGKVFIIGSFNTDLVYRVNDFPKSGETIHALNSCCLPGGKGSNQAIACSMAGARTHFTVKLGDDEFAQKALIFLKGIMFEKLTCFEQKNCATGSAIVMVSEIAGDNAIVINSGANQKFSRDDIISCYDDISQNDVFLTQMENNPDATAMALKYAYDSGLKTILNPAPWRKEVNIRLPLATIVTPNLTEAAAIVGHQLDTLEEIRLAAEKIHSLGAKNVLITLGKEGCWFFDGIKHHRFKAYPAVNVDTSGAGDAFNGALAARLANGECIKSAINYASMFASLAVEREGAANMPQHEETLRRIEQL